LDVTVRGPTGGREVTATGLGLYQSCVGKVTSFTIETLGRPGKEFDVVISGPQGNAVPVRCYQHRDGNLLAEFTTTSVGKIGDNLFILMRVSSVVYKTKILKLKNYY
jgi:filamin